MAMKFLTLEEAAQKLGISPEELNQLRERHEAHGYRDGSSWKFKVEEIERIASEGVSELSDSSNSIDLVDIPLDDDDEGDDMVLLSEAELGESDPSTSSTIIGKPGSAQDPSESDVRIVTGDETGSDVKLVADADSGDSGVKLAPSVVDVPDTPEAPATGESGLSLDDDSLELDLDFGSGVPLVQDDSPTDQVADADLTVDDDDAVSLAGEYGISGDDDDDDSGADINLGGESDDEFVLRGGSDITMGAGDSGISLADPADSGLSLADPLDLGGSSSGEALDLAGDEDASSDFELSSDSDSEALGDVGSDDDFLLTPMEDAGDADSEESGSQVIALDESDDFGASAAAMLDDAGGDMVSMVEDSEESVDFSETAGPSTYAGAPAMQPRGPEARFSTWDVVGLGACAMLLVLCGMVMFDLMRNMWSWNGTYAANGAVMNFILGLFE